MAAPEHRYFDHNATAPLGARARAAWLEAEAQAWANPSSPHRAGASAALVLRAARETLAGHLGCAPERLVFTSGATEANDALLRAFAGQALAISAIEHPSVREPARAYGGAEVFPIPVSTAGVLDLAALERRLQAGGLALVSVMAANNETGVLQPWTEAAALCRRAGVPLHCDATQWLGRLDPAGLAACDYVTAGAHKCGGPKGVGLLLLRSGSGLPQLQRGGAQEHGRRAGTENVPAIAAAVAAWTAPLPDVRPLAAARDAAAARLVRELGARVVGADAPRLWNTLGLILPRHDQKRWVARLDRAGFAASTGSACATGREGPSHVLAAMGHAPAEAARFVRCSGGLETSAADWQALADALLAAGGELDTEPLASVIDV